MKCYNCGCDLSEHDFCTACGADVGVYKRIQGLSNQYYNEGLMKAQVRDLSGAVDSLRQSLKCNKYNIEARNLLGLVYFEMGEAVEAMAEWVLSRNFQPKKNIADDFLKEVQNNPTKWDNIRQTIKKYNQALEYCYQDGIDLAIIQLKSLLRSNPNIIKGHQLLALLYINNEEWDKALKCINKIKHIDTNNTLALYYEKEIERAVSERAEAAPEGFRRKKAKEDVITYQSGNDTIIQPINHPERAWGGATVINIIIGLAIGAAIMWYLVLPSRIQAAQNIANKDLIEVSSQLTEKSAAMDELQKRTEALEAENASLMNDMQNITGSDGLIEASDTLMNAARRYIETPEEVIDIADTIESVDPAYISGDESSTAFQALYAALHDTVSKKASAECLEKGLDSLKDDKYSDAVELLTKAFELDDTNAEALYNLAHAYRRADDTSKAMELYKQVVSLFPETEYAKNSEQYIKDGNDASLDDNNDNAQQPEAVVPAAPVIPEVTTQMPGEAEAAEGNQQNAAQGAQ